MRKYSKTQLAEEDKPTVLWGVEIHGGKDLIHGKVFWFTWEVLCAKKVKLRTLQSLVGHWLWYALMVRPLLSYMTPLFRQAHSKRAWQSLWPSTRVVLRHFLMLAFGLVAHPGRRPGAVGASDSSDWRGGAVLFAEDAALYWELAKCTYYKGRGDLLTEEYANSLRAWVTKASPTAEFGWDWKTPAEHIGVKEGRAAAVVAQRLALRRGGAILQRRYSMLVDNQGVVGAFV
jgi:hypothetical protein